MGAMEPDGRADSASRVIRSIWKHPNSSRIALAERLGLDKSTITNQVSALLDMGLLEEIEEGESSARGGRKPIHLGIRGSYGRVLGVEIQSEAFVAVETDLSGRVIDERRGRTSIRPENFVDTVAGIAADSAARTGGPVGPLLGIGIGTGGLIDHKKNRIRYSVPLDVYETVDLAPELEARIPYPCFVENDANCCAWGELAFAKDDDPRNFIFALVEYRRDPADTPERGGIGVGFGIVLGGKVYQGSHGNAGEFKSAFCAAKGETQFSLGKAEIARLSSDRRVLESVCDELARNMALLINTMDFERVYVGGDIEEFGIDFPSMLRVRLEENWMYPIQKQIEISYSTLGGKAVAYGAAGMVLEKLISGSMLTGAEVGREGGSVRDGAGRKRLGAR